MFYIRTDANESIALGHLMRCLTIADAIRALGEDVTFIKADDYENARINGAGYSVICLGSDWNDMEGELPTLRNYIAEHKITSLLVDSYQVTAKYLKELKQQVKVFYLDDMADKVYPADVIVNYAFDDCSQIYKELYQDSQTRILLGSRYAPLRKAFRDIKPRNIRNTVSDILVTTGGSDPYHILQIAAESLAANKKYQEIKFHLVIGACVEEAEAEKIILHASQQENIRCYRNIPNMEEAMQRCDVAISAAGGTLYELCACQTPTICLAFADNQLPGIAAMERANIMLSIGDIRNWSTDQIEAELVKDIDRLQPADLRESYAKRMHAVTDGQGAIRLARELLELEI